MKHRSSELDMLHGPLAGKLLRFTLPIALSSIVQQLFNAADTAVVGSFGSADALAAVGTNSVHPQSPSAFPRWRRAGRGSRRR